MGISRRPAISASSTCSQPLRHKPGTRMAWTDAAEGPDTWSPYVVVGHLVHGERTDWIPQNSWLQIRWDEPGKYVRNVRINWNQWAALNFDGIPQYGTMIDTPMPVPFLIFLRLQAQNTPLKMLA
mgnify:CR=1 FL=1